MLGQQAEAEQRLVVWMPERMGQATARLTSPWIYRPPGLTATRASVEEILALVGRAAVGELTGLRRRRAEPVAAAEKVQAERRPAGQRS